MSNGIEESNDSQDGQKSIVARVVSSAMTNRGVVLSNIDEAYRFARAVTESGFAPKGMNQAGVLVAIQMGAELGLPPMASLQNIAVINGRPAVWGDAIPAICMGSGFFDFAAYRETIEQDKKSDFPVSASCTVRRLPDGELVKRTFTMSDAKRAKLMGKAGPWSEYPARMLQMRARSWAMRDAFPDFLRGFHVADRQSGEMVDGPPVVPSDTRTSKPTLDDLTTKMHIEQIDDEPLDDTPAIPDVHDEPGDVPLAVQAKGKGELER